VIYPQDFMTTSSPSPSQQSIWRFSAFNLILLLTISLWLWQQNKPVQLPEPKLPADGKLQCVSYSPYYKNGQTPLNIKTHISHEQIEQDLRKLSTQFQCVRIYSVGQGLDYVPEAASKLGMKVYLGAWIGWVKKLNEKELNLAIDVANKYPETVKALIIGNEVLLRGEQTESALKAYILRAKSSTRVPVTYADVWEFWRKHPKLEASVDFVTVHILPYWEDKPQSIEHAVDHTNNVMNLLGRTFKKPILIGETGWPSLGRPRESAQPSLINQAQYMRGFLIMADAKHWNYNLIEAFDQPWKRSLEGTAGGYWGIFNVDMVPKFAFSGGVAERHDGKLFLYTALITALLFLVWSLKLNNRNKSHLLSMSVLGALIGISTLLQIEYLAISCRTIQEWLSLGSIAVIGLISLLSIPAYIFNENKTAKMIIQLSLTFLLVAAVIANYLLSLDGRYRDFAIILYGLTVLELTIGLKLLKKSTYVNFSPFRFLGIFLVATAIFCFYKEPTNALAFIWLLLSTLITWANWPSKPASAI
jgi:exo-beta-1,3-glucanase (GH17 family)